MTSELRLFHRKFFICFILLTVFQATYVILAAEKGLQAAETHIEKGRVLIRQLGCVACHHIRKLDTTVKGEAPNLTYEGEIVRRDWLFSFLKRPHKVRPAIKARMIDFRLTDRETLAITEYLGTLVDRDNQAKDFLTYPLGSGTPEVIVVAKKLMSKDYFDCFSCHIRGSKMPSGEPENWAPDLTRVRSRINPDFLFKWLQNPSKYRPGTKMPAFFPDKDSGPDDILGGDEMRQIAAIRDYIFSIGNVEKFPDYAKAKKQFLAVTPSEGRVLMMQLNCVGCHEVAVLPGGKKVGPNLSYEGSRVQKEWLIDFLSVPHSIKLEFTLLGKATRMPTFHFTKEEISILVEYISTALVDPKAEKDMTLDPVLSTKGRKLFIEKKCNNCHRIGNKPRGIGPDLTEAEKRLRPGWVIRFVQQPSHFLKTRMPDLRISPEEARALGAYILGPKS